jgi:transposase
VAGERNPARLAAHRDRRCHESVEAIAQYLTGTWREEHLFNLAAALRLYDSLQDTIASYETHLLAQLEALQPPERQQEDVPRHPNPTKEKTIRHLGEQPLRTSLWRFAGADLTRIDGIRATAAQTVLTEVGPDVTGFPSENHFVSWLRLCPRTPISGGKPSRNDVTAWGPIGSRLHSGWPRWESNDPRPRSALRFGASLVTRASPSRSSQPLVNSPD